MIKRALGILNLKKGLEGLPLLGKLIAILYLPAICLMWWSYYMWRNVK